MLLDERGRGRAADGETVAESVLEPEQFPHCAELVLAQHILNRGLRSSGNGRTIGKSGEPGPYVWTGP